jgi:hypothetical protein
LVLEPGRASMLVSSMRLAPHCYSWIKSPGAKVAGRIAAELFAQIPFAYRIRLCAARSSVAR